MTRLKTLHEKWAQDPEYRAAYDALEGEFALAAAIAAARSMAGLTQEQVAQRMHTTQSNVARLEAGRSRPSTRTLEKFAEAVGARLKITFEPIPTR
jgi:ribosome-binding protein aMBF1 (putative translation factor)